MFKLLLIKDLKSIFLSPKFPAAFALTACLILLSIYIGIREYQAGMRQYETAVQLDRQSMAENSSWGGFSREIYRKPQPLQIFANGIHNDIGRLADINHFAGVKLRRSHYSDDPIFAVFRSIDLVFVVQIVLSLLAILFTYDAVNGERQSGTLKLTFANPVPRATYLLARFLGISTGLIVPLLIPLLIGVLLLLLYQIPMTGDDWSALFLLSLLSLLYFLFFIALGIAVSTFTRHPANAFLILLVVWVAMVLIIPRAGGMLAAQLAPVPSVAQIESQQAAYEQSRWNEYEDYLDRRLEQRNAQMAGMSPEERDAFRDDNMWDWMTGDDEARKKMEQEISEFNRRLNENLRNQRGGQERLAFLLSRLSPASAYQLAAISVTGSGISLKNKYEDALEEYRTTLLDFTGKKAEEEGKSGGISINISSESGFNFTSNDGIESLDLSEIPVFNEPQSPLAGRINQATIDIGILALSLLLVFTAGFWRFLKYDVR